jgi:hypothetical protein
LISKEKAMLQNLKLTITLFCGVLFSSISFSQQIAINEMMSSNTKIIKDENGDFEDWIEIYNYGTTTVNLAGFGLSDEVDNPYKWKFPSRNLAPNQYLIIWASDKNRSNTSGNLHTNFKMKSGGETIVLTNLSGTKIDQSPAVAIPTDKSYGRKPDGTGDWSFFETPTPNASNSTASNVVSEKISINEFMSSNSQIIADEDGSYEDWIELYNFGETTLNLNGFGLSDDQELPYKWVFPSVSIAPGQFLLIWASGKDRRTNAIFHTNFGISATGENIFLTNPSGVLVSGSPSIDLGTDVSYGRQPDGTGSWLYFNIPTPLASNVNPGTTTPLYPPSFSHESGLYSNNFELALTTQNQGATIIYTLDGSDPDINNLSGKTYQFKNDYPINPGDPFGAFLEDTYKSNSYSNTISILDKSTQPNELVNKNTTQFEHYIPQNPVRKATVIKAKTYLNGAQSKTISKTFFVFNGGNPYNIPVISLQIQENLLLDYTDGIYTAGKDFDTWRTQNPNNNQSWRPEISNFSRSGDEWEYPLNVELFEPTTLTSVQNINAGFRIHGNNSRVDAIKNLRLYARNEYDTKNEFKHDFFKQQIPDAVNPYNTDFKRILLRGDGSGGPVSYDVAFSKTLQDVFNGVTRIQPAIHFINGEFWGLTAFRDRFDRFHYKLNFGITEENFTQVSCNGNQCELDEGLNADFQSYIAMRDFIYNNDMSNNQLFNQASQMLDMNSMIENVIMMSFASNNGYERKFWKARNVENDEYGDGRWRLSVQDFEASLSTNTNWLAYLSNLKVSSSRNLTIFANLLANEKFKNQFISRFADVLNTVFKTSHFLEVINETFDEIAPYLPEDINRFPRPNFYKPTEKQNLIDWATNRPQEQRVLIKNQFNIAETFQVDLNVSDIKEGFIKINTINIREITPGVDENPYPWNGTYFKTIPVSIEAIAFPGFEFSHWSGDINSTNPFVLVTPTTDFQAQANFKAIENYSHLMHFWLFDENLQNDTPLQNINATYARSNTNAVINFNSSLNGYPFTDTNPSWRKASLERVNQPTPINYQSIANDEIEYNPIIMKGLQVKQPFKSGGLENNIEFAFSTVNYKDIQLSFAVASDGAAQTLIVEYWNGTNWISTGISSVSTSISFDYDLKEFDFKDVAIANNNANFKIRVRFDGSNMTEDEGKRVLLNNVAIRGIDTAVLSADDFALNRLSVYPNPTKDNIKIVSEKPINQVAIFNLFGQSIFTKKYDSENITIDVSSYAKGVYILKISSENSSIIKKIIKE